MKKISIVVSCYNEEEVLDKYYAAFNEVMAQQSCDYELIFVNDGSRDRSLEIIKGLAAADSHVKLVSFSRNFGHESAMIAGIDYATGDGIVCMDADLQHPVTCIPEIIDRFDAGYQVISMVRKANKSAGLIKNITSAGFYKVINLLSKNTHFEENASDFFAISKKAAAVLRSNYRERVRFLRGYVQSLGFKSTTIEYVAAERAGGASHYSLKKLVDFSINTIVCFSDFPLKLGIYAGSFSALLGIIVLVYSIITMAGAPSGYTTLVVLNCFMFAVLFIIVGVIGQYVSVLFTETKGRPIYITEELINFEEDASQN